MTERSVSDERIAEIMSEYHHALRHHPAGRAINDLLTAIEERDAEIKRIAEFIVENIPGEPSEPQGTIDTAMRLQEENETTVGEKIRILRKEKGWSQSELGKRMERPRSHAAVSDIERGVTEISFCDMMDICSIFDVPMSHFVIRGADTDHD